jgi:agmatine/peptidylarginine deiminase
MKHKITKLLAVMLLTSGMATAQNQDAHRRQQAATALMNLSPSEIRAAHSISNPREPAIPVSLKEAYKESKDPSFRPETTGATRLSMPSDMRVPGEFEEVQSIVLTWPYFSVDTNNEFTSQIFAGLGPYFDANDNFLGLGPITNFIDTLSASEFPEIFRQLVLAIEPHAAVWLNVWSAADTLALHAYMNAKGTPFTNTRFFVNPGNSFWYRDCGPVGFYYGPHDSIAYLDFEYYGGRPLDDDLPLQLAAVTGSPVFTTTIENEGGNILVDGVGTQFTTTAVYLNNGDTWGQVFLANPNDPNSMTWRTKTPLTQAQVRDSLINLMALDRLFVLPALRFDGGTGHIDLYLDQWDENTFVATQHPPQVNFIDVTLVNNNVNTIRNTDSYHGTPYKVSRIPLPSRDDGSWYTSGFNYELFTRTYSNHLIVNKAIVQPVYSDGVTGNVAGMFADLEIIQQKYPGYTIIPIDKRAFDGFGGSIHCITKQVPAENPLLILHDPIRGEHQQTSFDVIAEISNRSGIANANLVWRHKNGSWNTVPMTQNGGFWEAQIIGNSGALSDTVEYYLSASSNNGKTIEKPMTAPDGFYTFRYGSQFVSTGPDLMQAWEIGGFYPNPSTEATRIDIVIPQSTLLQMDITDAMGRNLSSKIIERGTYEFNTSGMAAGVYYVRFDDGAGQTVVRKLIVR